MLIFIFRGHRTGGGKMDRDEQSPVTIEQLTALKTASHDCLMVSRWAFAAPPGFLTAVLQGDSKAASDELRDYLLNTVLVVWESWNERLTYNTIECLHRFNAGRHDPVSVDGGLYATYHEAAGYLLTYLLGLPTAVDTNLENSPWKPGLTDAETRRFFLNWLCDQASDSLSLCRQVNEVCRKARPQVDCDRFEVGIVDEWARAIRGIETQSAPPSLLNEVCELLTPTQVKIVRFLWDRSHPTSWDTLATCWPNREAADAAIKKTLQRLTERLLAMDVTTVFLDVSEGKRTVRLSRPAGEA
ncbi:MAG: hypothetical protein ACYC4U_02350 [Pirellulaceae bacterium]